MSRNLSRAAVWSTFACLCGLAAVCLAPAAALAADPAGGFRPLFNGKDFTGWQNAGGAAPGAGWVVEEGAMLRNKGAGDIWTKERFGDFVLDLEYRTKGNSGVFIRTDNPRDCVQTGIEIQIDRPAKTPNRNSVGSIYDALAPSKDPSKPDQWNRMVITAEKNRLTVAINGEQIIDMDLDKWPEPGKNPDGSKNKYRTALKDFKREGHVGLQDHGAEVAYRNVKIKVLGK